MGVCSRSKSALRKKKGKAPNQTKPLQLLDLEKIKSFKANYRMYHISKDEFSPFSLKNVIYMMKKECNDVSPEAIDSC